MWKKSAACTGFYIIFRLFTLKVQRTHRFYQSFAAAWFFRRRRCATIKTFPKDKKRCLRQARRSFLKFGAASQKDMSQQDYELYGTYIPFSMAICHTINHKSGMDHTTYAHTGAMVNVYANGVGAEKFGGVFDNTEIFHKLADLTKVK